jgi:large subunit ribosomal protein L21e
MTKRRGGFRRKTRKKFTKAIKEKGKISLTNYLREFKIGEGVVLKAEPSIHKGMYFPRFHGKSGIIKEKVGGCYKVLIKDFNKEKELIIHPVHLRRL